jgi:hypothetical protein
MKEQNQTDLQRAGEWLSGEVRVSRKVLVLGGVVMLVLLGVALD